MDINTACELAFKNGQREVAERVEKYLLKCIDEWNGLGDRKYDLANAQVYNHVRKCLDDLESMKNALRL